MSNFVLTSLIASIVLTLAINILPFLFPNAAAKAQRKIEENAHRAIEQHEDTGRPRVKVFFPWKAMIVISLVLTVVINLVGAFAGSR
ncbi:MAG: DUF2905 domain-containing protein [Hyphomonadaceae bacterium]|nr:DUF2905 domain-containing protein [Hyphomonadaceae bacterium]